MLTLTQRIDAAPDVQGTLTLPFELRCRSRLRAQLDDGREVALFLPRGEVLHGGDLLQAEDGQVIRIQSESETLSEVRATDPLKLARACYHLGNRHVALQIEEGCVRYLRDTVLDEMVRSMGLNVVIRYGAFEPEPGAYGGGHTHGHEEAAGHEHAHGDETDPHDHDSADHEH